MEEGNKKMWRKYYGCRGPSIGRISPYHTIYFLRWSLGCSLFSLVVFTQIFCLVCIHSGFSWISLQDCVKLIHSMASNFTFLSGFDHFEYLISLQCFYLSCAILLKLSFHSAQFVVGQILNSLTWHWYSFHCHSESNWTWNLSSFQRDKSMPHLG